MPNFVFHTPLPVPVADVFDWHMRPGALPYLTPSWAWMKKAQLAGSIADGGHVHLGFGPLGIVKWHLRHTHFKTGECFQDEQVKGPFRSWRHTHRFVPLENGCRIEDHIQYECLPVFKVFEGYIQKQLKRLFEYRAHRLRQFACYPGFEQAQQPRTIGITGSQGLIGQALQTMLTLKGHRVVPLIRKDAPFEAINSRFYSLDNRYSLEQALEGIDVWVHLAAEPIMGIWTKSKKSKIYHSRVSATQAWANCIREMANPPQLCILASGIGFYGNCHTADETTGAGKGFLAHVVQDWEKAADPIRKRGIRCAHMRMAPVLSPTGGMLRYLKYPYQLGLGAILGSGQSQTSWISLEDSVRAYLKVIEDDQLEGPINVASPACYTNEAFCRELAKALKRPLWMRIPSAWVKKLPGHMGEEVFLTSGCIQPKKLLTRGFQFQDLSFGDYLSHVL